MADKRYLSVSSVFLENNQNREGDINVDTSEFLQILK